MNSGFGDIFSLFFPPVCPSCGRKMGSSRDVLCAWCQAEIPLTGFENMADNPVVRIFWGLVPVVGATSFAWFGEGGRSVVHRMKYSGKWRFGYDLGRWFGRVLADADPFAGVDFLVPVPLHPLKTLRRGYNQSDYIARGIASEMGIRVLSRAVERRVNTTSQTTKKRDERWANVAGVFAVKQPEKLAGRHILLVDDVLTTGATVASLAEEILKTVPDCRISIATLYASRALVGGRE